MGFEAPFLDSTIITAGDATDALGEGLSLREAMKSVHVQYIYILKKLDKQLLDAQRASLRTHAKQISFVDR